MSSLIVRPTHTAKLLGYLTWTRNLKQGKVVHARLIVSDQVYQEDEANSLINLYSKCAEMESAHQVFDKMNKRNVVSWGALMAGLSQNGFSFEALRLYKSMVLDDLCPPNEFILSTVLSCCCNVRYILFGRQCHGYVFKSGLVFHQYVKNALVSLYSMFSDTVGAMEVLTSVPGSDTCTYNLILDRFAKSDYLDEALNILKKMLDERVIWDKSTYIGVFGLCARLKYLKLGHQVHNKLLKSDDVEFDVFLCSAIINMYGKCKEISNARKVFNNLKTQNVVSWTSMLDAYSQYGSFEESLKLFLDMQQENISPNDSTFSVLLVASSGLSSLRYGSSLHSLAEKMGYKGHRNVGNALINLYSKTGDIEAAKKMFDHMTFRDTVTWNTIICGYSYHGLGNESLALFEQMLKLDENPNHVTFIGVLNACGHLEKVELGFYYLNHLMKQKGIEPNLEHYTCIVGLLSKAGRLNEALNFMLSTRINWDAVSWRTLLRSCLVHRNYIIGTKVANFIMRLDPNDVGTYTLLSNMYARSDKWDGVANIRELMKKRNIKKEPGLSWLEIKNQTHVFISDDNGHPEFVQIQEMLKELFCEIKAVGYVADTANVLHDVEDGQKD